MLISTMIRVGNPMFIANLTGKKYENSLKLRVGNLI